LQLTLFSCPAPQTPQKAKLTKEALSNSINPFLQSARETIDLKANLMSTEEEMQKLKSAKFTSLHIKEKFDKAGKLAEYFTVYSMLCLETHNNIRSLEERYIEKLGDNDWRLVFTLQDKVSILHIVSAFPGVLLFQTKNICEFFKILTEFLDKPLSRFLEMQERVKSIAKQELANRVKKSNTQESGSLH